MTCPTLNSQYQNPNGTHLTFSHIKNEVTYYTIDEILSALRNWSTTTNLVQKFNVSKLDCLEYNLDGLYY